MSLPFEMYLVAPNERHHEEDILQVLLRLRQLSSLVSVGFCTIVEGLTVKLCNKLQSHNAHKRALRCIYSPQKASLPRLAFGTHHTTNSRLIG